MSLIFRLHEWCAERIPGVQYPKPQVILARPEPPLFKHQMPFWKRYLLILFAMAAIPFGLILLFFAGLVVWAIIKS